MCQISPGAGEHEMKDRAAPMAPADAFRHHIPIDEPLGVLAGVVICVERAL
jgi:hypothetical protein